MPLFRKENKTIFQFNANLHKKEFKISIAYQMIFLNNHLFKKNFNNEQQTIKNN